MKKFVKIDTINKVYQKVSKDSKSAAHKIFTNNLYYKKVLKNINRTRNKAFGTFCVNFGLSQK